MNFNKWLMMELMGANKASYLYRPKYLTWLISSGELIFHALLLRWAVIAFMALFIPFRKSITLTPAATALHPSVRIACVSTVAQVVPISRTNQKKSEWNYTPLRQVKLVSKAVWCIARRLIKFLAGPSNFMFREMCIGEIYQKLTVFSVSRLPICSVKRKSMFKLRSICLRIYWEKTQTQFNMGLDWRLEVCETVFGWHSDFSA